MKTPVMPECDKELAAREPREDIFTSFLDWIGTHDWRFCTVGDDDRYRPIDDRLLQRLVPTPDEGGSQELGAWLDFDLPGLELCAHILSNYTEVRARVTAENGGTPIHWLPTDEWDYVPQGWYPIHRGIKILLADFFGIDRAAADRERAALLAAIRGEAA